MSRLSTDEIRIYLHPQRLVMARLSGWLRPKIIAKEVIADWENKASPSDYTASLTALGRQLKRAQWQNARATVILSGHGTHYRLSPWSPALRDEEQAALLRHRYSEIFGKPANSWKISYCDSGYGKQGLACAIDNVLLEQIQAAFISSTVRLENIHPILMGAFNQYRRQITTGTSWFILLESDWISVGLLNDKGWAGIRCLPHGSYLNQKLDIQLQRWAMQFGEDESHASVYLSCVDPKIVTPSFSSARRVVRLTKPEHTSPSRSENAGSDTIWAPVQYQS